MLVPFGCLSVMSLSKLSFQPPKTAIWLSGQSGAGVGTYRQNARKAKATKASDVTACSAFANHFICPSAPNCARSSCCFGRKGARPALTMPLIFRFLYLAQRLYR